ncbi:MAG: heavy-metal-associated domain-containing protein [Chloroflexi bacterium]|nr:heavy-metal-associated domain-containing protein [Chloroflexota bacterium]
MTKKKFQIKGMHCVSCAMNVEGALEDLPGVKTARVNYAKASAEVEFDEQEVNEKQMIEAIQKAGYAIA